MARTGDIQDVSPQGDSLSTSPKSHPVPQRGLPGGLSSESSPLEFWKASREEVGATTPELYSTSMARLLPKAGWERRLMASPTLFFLLLLLFFAEIPPTQARGLLPDPRQVLGSALGVAGGQRLEMQNAPRFQMLLTHQPRRQRKRAAAPSSTSHRGAQPTATTAGTAGTASSPAKTPWVPPSLGPGSGAGQRLRKGFPLTLRCFPGASASARGLCRPGAPQPSGLGTPTCLHAGLFF